MPKPTSGYEEKLAEVIETLKHSPEELNKVLETSGEVVHAASDMTKDELALISARVRSDLKEFAQEYEESKSGPFYLMIANSIWEGMLEITDRTKIEWLELFEDLEHKGVYRSGDVIGLGNLVCEKCGHKTQYNHPTVIEPCIHCGCEEFTRVPLKP